MYDTQYNTPYMLIVKAFDKVISLRARISHVCALKSTQILQEHFWEMIVTGTTAS